MTTISTARQISAHLQEVFAGPYIVRHSTERSTTASLTQTAWRHCVATVAWFLWCLRTLTDLQMAGLAYLMLHTSWLQYDSYAELDTEMFGRTAADRQAVCDAYEARMVEHFHVRSPRSESAGNELSAAGQEAIFVVGRYADNAFASTHSRCWVCDADLSANPLRENTHSCFQAFRDWWFDFQRRSYLESAKRVRLDVDSERLPRGYRDMFKIPFRLDPAAELGSTRPTFLMENYLKTCFQETL